jgi:hypothetical protein
MWRFTNPGNAVWALVILLLSAGQWCMYAQRRIGIKSSFLLISGDIGFLAVLNNILYRQAGAGIEVLAVAPHRRCSDYWIDRG